MRRTVCIACCILSLSIPMIAQTRRPSAQPELSTSPRNGQPVVQHRPYQQTWYDLMLRQFNPQNLDWGRWVEQRRQELLDETAANPPFKYSLVTTLLLVLLTIALAKSQIDKSRIKWLAQERHEDLLAHDKYSRQVARDAIRKYNAHMENCNRVVEAEAAGRSTLTSTPLSTQGAITLDQALAENAQLKRERDRIDAELKATKSMVGDLTARINGMSAGDSAAETGPAQGEFMKQFNGLREKLYRERERNKQLKGL